MFYKEISLPVIPEKLYAGLFDSFDYYLTDVGYGRNHEKNGKSVVSCEYGVGHIRHQALLTWLKSVVIPNAPEDIKFLYHQQKPKDSGASTHIAHSDLNRCWGLNYMIELGGDDVVTNWYQEHHKPLRRVKTVMGVQTDSGYVDYANTQLLVSTRLQKHKWYLLETDVLHEVENITGTRQSITISLTKDHANIANKLLEKAQ